MKILLTIKQNFLSLLRNKSGKTGTCSACEHLHSGELMTESELKQKQSDLELEDIVLKIVLLPLGLVNLAGHGLYYAGKGVYQGAKKLSEAYQNFKKQ